jgi:hypothetical protein
MMQAFPPKSKAILTAKCTKKANRNQNRNHDIHDMHESNFMHFVYIVFRFFCCPSGISDDGDGSGRVELHLGPIPVLRERQS